MNQPIPQLSGAVEAPVLLSTAPYISPEYARAERDRLWLKTWLVACREEEIPRVGDFKVYELLDQSLIVVRTGEGADDIVAYHNACRHRGRRLLQGCGKAMHFRCPYHGWQWNLSGVNTYIQDREDWAGALEDDKVRLQSVRTGRWGGFVFVNFDADCEPLEAFLQTVPDWLGVFETGKMRYRWRQWLKMDCNWKIAVEAFIEGYHAQTTHPQISNSGGGKVGSSAEGLHARLYQMAAAGGGIGTGVNEKADVDIRQIPYIGLKQAQETVWSNTTDTFVEAARQLPELLPEGVSKEEVSRTLMETACRIDAERGVDWPQVAPEHMMQVGINWHVFPNTVLLPNVTFCLGFHMRPDGFNPDSSIMEVFALERYPAGEEPETKWEYRPDQVGDSWPLLIKQDFRNLAEQQAGMHSVSTQGGLRPNPVQEASVINFGRNLADYMGDCAPQLLEPGGS